MSTFARARGRPSLRASAGPAVSAAGLILAIARASGASGRTAGLAASALGAVGALASLWGWYAVASRSAGGRRVAQAGVAGGALAILVAVVGGASQDGSLRLDRFGASYLDATILADAFPVLLRGVWNTLRLAVVAEVVAIAIGITVSALAISGSRFARVSSVVYVDVIRGLPIVVLTSLIYGGLPSLGVTLPAFGAAVAILGMNSGAYSAEIFRAGIGSVPRGQVEAARSLGMPHAQTMSVVVLPQAARNVLPPLVSDFIALLKDTAIVLSFIGLAFPDADIFSRARGFASSTFSPTPYILAAGFYLALTVPLARLVGVLERKVRAGYA